MLPSFMLQPCSDVDQSFGPVFGPSGPEGTAGMLSHVTRESL